MVEGDGAEFTCVYDGQATTITLFLSDIQIESDNYRLRGMQDSNGNMLRSNQLGDLLCTTEPVTASTTL